ICCIRIATSETNTLSLHDALPILLPASATRRPRARNRCATSAVTVLFPLVPVTAITRAAGFSANHSAVPEVTRVPLCCACSSSRSEEHTSELQSRENLVCRLLLEK